MSFINDLNTFGGNLREGVFILDCVCFVLENLSLSSLCLFHTTSPLISFSLPEALPVQHCLFESFSSECPDSYQGYFLVSLHLGWNFGGAVALS